MISVLWANLISINIYQIQCKESMDAHIESILNTHHKNMTREAYNLLIDSLYYDEKALMDPNVNSLQEIHQVISDIFPDHIIKDAQEQATQVSIRSYDLDTANALYNIKEATMKVRITDILNRVLKNNPNNPIITIKDMKNVIYEEPDIKRCNQHYQSEKSTSSPHISMASKSPLYNIISKHIQNINITPLALQKIEKLITPYYQAIQSIHQDQAFHDWLQYIFSNQRLINIKYAIEQETEGIQEPWRLNIEKEAFIDYLIYDLIRLISLQSITERRPIIDTDHITIVLQTYPYLFPHT